MTLDHSSALIVPLSSFFGLSVRGHRSPHQKLMSGVQIPVRRDLRRFMKDEEAI